MTLKRRRQYGRSPPRHEISLGVHTLFCRMEMVVVPVSLHEKNTPGRINSKHKPRKGRGPDVFAHVLRAGMWRGESWQVQLRVGRAGAANRVCVLCFFSEI